MVDRPKRRIGDELKERGGGVGPSRREPGVTGARLQALYDARDQFARTLGATGDDLLGPFVNPTFGGGPRWPSLRQSWRPIRRRESTAIVSDGLSDPFDDDESPNVGLGIESVVEASGKVSSQLQRSWLFQLVYDVSQQAADSGEFLSRINKLGLFSMELFLGDAFKALKSPSGTVGVLLAIEPDFTPLLAVGPDSIRYLTAKLLNPSELAFARAGGATARAQLRDRFHSDGTAHRSSLRRKSVV